MSDDKGSKLKQKHVLFFMSRLSKIGLVLDIFTVRIFCCLFVRSVRKEKSL